MSDRSLFAIIGNFRLDTRYHICDTCYSHGIHTFVSKILFVISLIFFSPKHVATQNTVSNEILYGILLFLSTFLPIVKFHYFVVFKTNSSQQTKFSLKEIFFYLILTNLFVQI